MAILGHQNFSLCALVAFAAVVVAKDDHNVLANSCLEGDDFCVPSHKHEEDRLPAVSLLQRAATVVEKGEALKHAKVSTGDKHGALKTRTRMPPVFFNVASLDWIQLLLVTIIYGYVLYVGSNMLGDGSELLNNFPSVAGIVGSVVVPILGAVPDSMMVLFSGLGPDAQSQVSTGVGALAGSTVMLLTFPWFVVNMTGSVPMGADGKADYGSEAKGKPAGLFTSAVTFGNSVAKNTKIMVVTSLAFLIIQIPAWFYDSKGVSMAEQSAAENPWALAGLIVSLLLFCGYIGICYASSTEDKFLEAVIDSIKTKSLSLGAVMLHCKETNMSEYMPKILRCFFARYDTDATGTLNETEFAFVLRDLGEDLSKAEIRAVYEKCDTDRSGELSFAEFCKWATDYMALANVQRRLSKQKTKLALPAYDVDDEEEEEIPEDLADLPPDEQSRRLLQRSIFLMLVGTILVLLFANPAVDVFNEWGDRLGISSFYVSFLLAPFASNASELLVAYGMALKKTSKSVTQSFESLVGAACMNNTLCLAVLYFLIYYKNLVWQFKAETAGILIIQWIMAILIFSSNTQPKFLGIIILCMYPLCLLIVYFLENVCGWD